MAENKLFYNVSESNANAFKDLKKDEKVLGLVHSGLDGDFGYFISQGKQFGASKADIADIAKSNISGGGSFMVGTTKYSIGFTDGVLSVNEYIATTLGNLTLSSLTNGNTASGGGTFYVGATTTVKTQAKYTSKEQTLTIPVNNTTKNEFKVEVWDGGSSYTYTTKYMSDSSASFKYTTTSIPTASTLTETPVTVEWKNYTAQESKTTGAKTFTAYLYEKVSGSNDIVTKKTISQSNTTASQTVTAKLPVIISKDSTFKTVLKTFDVTYANRTKTIGEYSFTAAEGMILYIAIPADLSSHNSKIKLIDTSMNLPVDGAFNATPATAVVLPTSQTGIPASIKYYITSSKAFTGADGFKVVIE